MSRVNNGYDNGHPPAAVLLPLLTGRLSSVVLTKVMYAAWQWQ